MDLYMIHKEFDQLCRFCLSKEECISIFTVDLELNERLTKLLDILLPKINENDGLPNRMCLKCVNCVEQFVEFESSCEKSYEVLFNASHIHSETKAELEENNGSEVKSCENADDRETNQYDDEYLDNPKVEYIDECLDNGMETIERLDHPHTEIEEQVILPENETENTAEIYKENRNESIILTNEQQDMIDTAMEVQALGFIERGNRKVPLVECIYCKNVYRGRNTLKKHLRIHLNIKENQCAYCPKAFTDRSSLRIHQGRHTGKSFKCSYCGKSYFSQNELRQHLKMQHAERRYTCETCQKKFPSKTILNDHYRVHRPERPFICSKCGAGFKRNRNLVRHMLVHEKSKIEAMPPLKCQLCVESFQQPKTLLEHLKSMHDDQIDSISSGTFECLHCDGSKFSDLLESLNHIQTHYPSIPKVKIKCLVSCGECGKTFKSRSTAKEHMSTHKANGCYSCFLCDGKGHSIMFKNLAQLNIHQNEAHK